MPTKKTDVAIVHGVTDDGKGLKILRARSDSIEAGEVRPIEQGKPIHGDLVRLQPRPGAPFVCDVVTDYSATTTSGAPKDSLGESEPSRPSSTRQRKGPAQVASDTYRANWEAIWAKPSRNDAPN